MGSVVQKGNLFCSIEKDATDLGFRAVCSSRKKMKSSEFCFVGSGEY